MTHAALVSIQGWCPWCGSHMGWGGWTMMILWWLLIIAIVVVIVWALRRGVGSRALDSRDPAEEALREQYARGEIDEETYRRRRDELRRS